MQKKLLKKLNRNLGTLINDVGCYPLDFKPYRLMSASKLFPRGLPCPEVQDPEGQRCGTPLEGH